MPNLSIVKYPVKNSSEYTNQNNRKVLQIGELLNYHTVFLYAPISDEKFIINVSHKNNPVSNLPKLYVMIK